MQKTSCDTYWCKIFISGNPDWIRRVCQEYAHSYPICVTVTPTTYVYTGGEEQGVEIGLINYPRFPSESQDKLTERALHLGHTILNKTFQGSFSVMTPERTILFDRRDNFPK